MRWVVVLVGIAAGCFDPNAQPGSPCGENGACPGALVCVNGTCQRDGSDPDASIDSPPADAEVDAMIDALTTPTDNDGDGVTNMQDNCVAMSNADQHDEDADSVGDVCDNCPHVANANQANAMDSDSVGDVCDPNPTLGGDSIARFLPMHVVPSMVNTLGTWQQIGDAYVHTNNQDSALVVEGGPWADTTVLISATQQANIVPYVWVAATVGESAGGYYYCGYADEQSGSYTDYHRAMWGPGSGTDWVYEDAVEHYNAQRLAGAFTIRLHADAAADKINCTAIDTRGTVNTGTQPTGDPFTPGNVGIRSEGITYSVNYIVVFTR